MLEGIGVKQDVKKGKKILENCENFNNIGGKLNYASYLMNKDK